MGVSYADDEARSLFGLTNTRVVFGGGEDIHIFVLAVMRWNVENAIGQEPVEEWNRFALQVFCDRSIDRLGQGTCRTGRHQNWPAASRYSAFLNDAMVNADQSPKKAPAEQ